MLLWMTGRPLLLMRRKVSLYRCKNYFIIVIIIVILIIIIFNVVIMLAHIPHFYKMVRVRVLVFQYLLIFVYLFFKNV